MDDFWGRFDWAAMVQQIGIAIVILLVTWLVAKLVRSGVSKLAGRVKALQRPGADGRQLGDSLGQVAALLVWLFGLIAVLQVFSLMEVLTPIRSMLESVFAFLPNLIGAAFIFVVGYLIAKILRDLIRTGLGTVDLGGLARRAKAGADKVGPTGGTTPTPDVGATAPAPTEASASSSAAPGGTMLASVVANLVFGIVMIVVSIAALQVLGITAISQPAEQMLTIILAAIPAIIAAVLILGLGYLIARFVGDLLEGTLRGLGTDKAVSGLGIVPEGQSASAILTRVAQVAIVIFFAIMATRTLNFPEVTAILNEVLSLGGRVLFGAAIIAAGFLVARLVANALGGSTVSTVVRYATIVLFVAMGLQYMGLADSIVNLAFGAVVVGGALAAALAYGLGGRDAAARSLATMQTRPGPDRPTDPGDPGVPGGVTDPPA